MSNTKKVLLSALFLASSIVLGRILSIRTPIVTIGFSFVPLMLAAIMLGWKHSTFIATMSDIIGALLFPTGSFFIGFTIKASLTGLVYGLLLYNKNGFKIDKAFIFKLILSCIIVSILLNGILNTIIIMIYTGSASKLIVPIRLIKELIMVPIKVVTILLITRIFKDKINEVMQND